MKILVTGSSGHLGEGLMRTLRAQGREALGLDILEGPYTDVVGSISDRECVRACMAGIGAVMHPATLHKPHVATHSAQDFVDTNMTGTLVLLEQAVAAGVGAFIFTSTTSTFGWALRPPAEAPAAWVVEDLCPVPKNIYGVTKTAAEDLCQLYHQRHGLPCLVLRTSRFFPEEDDAAAIREGYDDANVKANELLFRRIDVADVVAAHLRALERAPAIGFDKYIVSATTPFRRGDLQALRRDAPSVVRERVPTYAAVYERLGWRMFPSIDRVYVNDKARRDLGWEPAYDFARTIACLERGEDPRSPLARAVGAKGYHAETFETGPYPVDEPAA